jgi:aspartyl-tRNA(Asn)/glutamyl-tRNA(Gln) amidotransferase subunit B
MRGKFEGPCIPDPTVPPIIVSEAWKNELLAGLPEMPARKAERFKEQYGLTADEAQLMSAERDLAEYFEAVVGQKIAPRTATHWLATQLLPALKERNQTLAETPVAPGRLASLLAMLEKEEINANAARAVLVRLFDSDRDPAAIVEEAGFRQVSDSGELTGIVERVLAANSSAMDDYRNGVAKAIGFLIGQVMQASKGKANPKLVREILTAKLEASR